MDADFRAVQWGGGVFLKGGGGQQMESEVGDPIKEGCSEPGADCDEVPLAGVLSADDEPEAQAEKQPEDGEGKG